MLSIKRKFTIPNRKKKNLYGEITAGDKRKIRAWCEIAGLHA